VHIVKSTHLIFAQPYGSSGKFKKIFFCVMLRYGEEDLAGAKSLVDQCPADDPDTEMNLACLLAKEGRLQALFFLSFLDKI
jgi:hypothetical protein